MEQGILTVYTASAGAGKTYTLAAEYIALLLRGDSKAFRHVLAVTFTNKATAEMKERILQYLYDMGHNEAFKESDFFATVRGFLREGGIACSTLELQERARAVLSELLHDFDNFRVETIDSFFQSMLTHLAHDLGLSATFRIELNDEEVIKKAIDRLILKVGDNPQQLRWMEQYVEKKFSEEKNWDFRKDLHDFAKRLLGEEYLKHSDTVEEEMQYLDEYERKLYQLREEIVDLWRTAVEHLDEMIAHGALPLDKISFGAEVKTYIELVRKGDYDMAADKEELSRFVAKTSDKDAWLKAAEKKRGIYGADAEMLKDILSHCATYSPKLRECAVQLDKLKPLRLLQAVSKEMNLLNEENNNFLLKNTPQLFAQLVKADAEFVFERVGTRFHHIMIDEFQDTSRLQWENFKTLLLENTSSGNKNMVVGDVKQSIYRWRNGDWKILGHIREEKPASMSLDEKTLLHNHRSGRAIVAFNNDFFTRATAMLDRLPNSRGGFSELYSAVRQEVVPSKGEGYVKVSLFDKETETCEPNEEYPNGYNIRLDGMVEEMQSLRRQGMPYSEMAILVRSNHEAARVVDFFQASALDIPIVSPDAFLLNASPAVQMIVHALHTLNFQLRTDKQMAGKMKRAASLAYLAKEYQRHIRDCAMPESEMMERVEEYLPEAFFTERAQLLRLPLFELCERLIALFELHRIEGQSPYLFFFLDCVLDYLNEHASSINAFLEHWEEHLHKQALPAADTDGVQVTTVHKSKGLAFTAVFIPFADWELEKSRFEIIHWTQETDDANIKIIPINIQRKAVRKTKYESDYWAESKEQRIEELNAAYVAFTRPRTHLFLWAKVKSVKELSENPTLGDLLYHGLTETEEEFPLAYEYGSASVVPKKESVTISTNPLEISPTNESIEYVIHDTRFEFKQSNDSHRYLLTEEELEAQQQKDYLLRGNLLHEVFSHIHTPEDVRSVIERMSRQGLFAQSIEADQLRALVEDSLRHPQVQEWFDGSWRLFNECTILTRTSDGVREYRPDRVMLKDDHTVVVDYKFGKPCEKYRTQVLGYVHLLERMGYPRVEGYLWYVFSNEVITVQA